MVLIHLLYFINHNSSIFFPRPVSLFLYIWNYRLCPVPVTFHRIWSFCHLLSLSPAFPLLTSSMEEGVRSSGSCRGVVLSCTDKLNRRTVLVRPVSKQDTFSHFSGFFPPVRIQLLSFCGWLCFTSINSGWKRSVCAPQRCSRSQGLNLVWMLLRNFPQVLNSNNHKLTQWNQSHNLERKICSVHCCWMFWPT